MRGYARMQIMPDKKIINCIEKSSGKTDTERLRGRDDRKQHSSIYWKTLNS